MFDKTPFEHEMASLVVHAIKWVAVGIIIAIAIDYLVSLANGI